MIIIIMTITMISNLLVIGIVGLFFLCWGSFLNVVAYRLIANKSLGGRSSCPHCNHTLAWYHLIPVASWLWLRGRCGFCHHPISWLYPVIELLTAVTGTALFMTYESTVFFAYSICASALIVTIRTDIEHLLIARIMSIGLIPAALAFQLLGFLPLSFFASLMGAAVGYASLWTLKTLFWHVRKQEGIGVGDLELLAGIGSFVGPLGVLLTLLISSITGTLIGALFLLMRGKMELMELKLPFGALMALAAISYLLFQNQILELLFY